MYWGAKDGYKENNNERGTGEDTMRPSKKKKKEGGKRPYADRARSMLSAER